MNKIKPLKKSAQLTLAALLLFTACNTDSRHGIPENCEDLDRTDVYEVANFAYLAMMDEDIEELMCLVDKENENIDLESKRESFEVGIEFFNERQNTEHYADLKISFYDFPLTTIKGPLVYQYIWDWTKEEKSYQVIFAEALKHNEAYVIVLMENEEGEFSLFSTSEFPDLDLYNSFGDYIPE